MTRRCRWRWAGPPWPSSRSTAWCCATRPRARPARSRAISTPRPACTPAAATCPAAASPPTRDRLLLPALGSFTGGLNVLDPAIHRFFPTGFHAYLLGRERVFRFPAPCPVRRAGRPEPSDRLVTQPAIVWFRNDLRLADNPALTAAMAEGGEVIPVYILDDAAAGAWRLGGAARWWLHGSLASLQATLGGARPAAAAARRGLGRADRPAGRRDAVPRPCSGTGATSPGRSRRTRRSRPGCERRGIRARSFNGSLGREPWEVQRDRRRALQGVHAVLACLGCARAAARALAGARTRGGARSSPIARRWPRLEPAADRPGLGGGPARGLAAGRGREPGPSCDDFVDGRIARLQGRPRLPGAGRRVAPVAAAAPRRALAAADLAPRPGGGGLPVPRRSCASWCWREFAHHLLFHFPRAAGRAAAAGVRPLPLGGR